jgi:hypothetical protein
VTARYELTRAQILAHRRRVGSLDRRLPAGADSVRVAAQAGLQDSMPRAAVLAVHARVAGTPPDVWRDPALVQVWGPRFSAYAVAAEDRAVFTLGRLPDDEAGLRRAVETADRLEAFLGGRSLPFGEVGRGMGVAPNSLRYAAPTGRVLIRWDGARQPTVWMVPAPDMDRPAARLELLRRYLRVLGPGTVEGFCAWAGVRPAHGAAAFRALARELVPVSTPVGEGWILAEDEPSFAVAAGPTALARLLPSGDAFTLLQGSARELLVPDAANRSRLWTPRVWPGALLVGGEVAGTWRRADDRVTLEPWRVLSAAERAAVEAEARSLPLPGLARPIAVSWSS